MTTSAQPRTGGPHEPDPLFTWSPEDSPASPSALRVASSALRTRGTSGRRSWTSFATYDPHGCCWRTSRVSFEGDSETYSETWPRAGMTRSGTAYPLPPLAPLTGATGSSSLPTQRAADADRGGRGDLLAKVRTGRTSRRRDWPTMTASRADRWSLPSPEVAAERWAEGRRNLDDAVALWPTPTASRRSGLQSHGQNAITGQLNPEFVEWLMGFPKGWTEVD